MHASSHKDEILARAVHARARRAGLDRAHNLPLPVAPRPWNKQLWAAGLDCKAGSCQQRSHPLVTKRLDMSPAVELLPAVRTHDRRHRKVLAIRCAPREHAADAEDPSALRQRGQQHPVFQMLQYFRRHDAIKHLILKRQRLSVPDLRTFPKVKPVADTCDRALARVEAKHFRSSADGSLLEHATPNADIEDAVSSAEPSCKPTQPGIAVAKHLRLVVLKMVPNLLLRHRRLLYRSPNRQAGTAMADTEA
jgi:hypothetical protein